MILNMTLNEIIMTLLGLGVVAGWASIVKSAIDAWWETRNEKY